jgi:ornithine cyclodeaminase
VSGGLWVTEAEVAGALDLAAAIGTVRSALGEAGRGEATTMEKTHLLWEPAHSLHALGGVLPSARVVGAKVWANTPRGSAPLLLLYSADDGALLAAVEAHALGQLRTAATTAVATDQLAAPGAGELAVVGTGRQALAQVAAVAAVRPLRSVRVHGRDPERRQAFAERVTAELGLATTVCDSVAATVEGAPLLVLVTRATTPFLEATMVARGAHVNAVGAITPERMEFVPGLLDRCTVVAVDSRAAAQRLAAELIAHYGDGGWEQVRELAALLAADERRPAGADVTLFKAMGIGLSDVALGVEVLRRVRSSGQGRPLPEHVAAAPRLRTGGAW